MISITDKQLCVGCGACEQRCPTRCISLSTDEQGFLYPHVDTSKCINCNLCEKVCPVINRQSERIPPNVYSSVNSNETILMNSSSGGVFTALAQSVINNGGVVFGVRFNDKWEAVHDFTETIEGLEPLRFSKYTQSHIGDCYKKAEQFLKSGRLVMFTGTPCQLAGLSKYLQHDYDAQLIKVDIVCHGVPSPMIWQKYLEHESTTHKFKTSDITNICLRDKRNGWERFGVSITFSNEDSSYDFYQPFYDNLFMNGFLKDLYLRPSCYNCPAKSGKSTADITIADFWSINTLQPDFYNFNGVSLILSFTEKGNKILQQLNLPLNDSTYEIALAANPPIEKSVTETPWVAKFWADWTSKGISAISDTLSQIKLSQQKVSRTKHIFKKIANILKL